MGRRWRRRSAAISITQQGYNPVIIGVNPFAARFVKRLVPPPQPVLFAQSPKSTLKM